MFHTIFEPKVWPGETFFRAFVNFELVPLEVAPKIHFRSNWLSLVELRIKTYVAWVILGVARRPLLHKFSLFSEVE